MKTNKVFEKTKEVAKSLEGFSYSDAEKVLKGAIDNIEYRKNKTLKEAVFIYEDLEIG